MKSDETCESSATPVACNLGAFTPEQRERWKALGASYIAGARTRRELLNGFAFEIERASTTLVELAQFVELESRCCPFVTFAIRAAAGERFLVLEMTGADGVKEILASELGLS